LSPMLPRTPAVSWCCAPWLVFATPASCCLLVVRHPCVLLPWSRRLHCGSLHRGWVALVVVCYAGVIVVFVVPLLLVVIVSSFPPPLSSFSPPPLVVCPLRLSSFALSASRRLPSPALDARFLYQILGIAQ